MSREKTVPIKKDALESALQQNGLTMKDLAYKLHRNYQSFWRSINNEKVTNWTLHEISETLNVSIRYLQGKTTVMHSRAVDLIDATHPFDVVDIALRQNGHNIKEFNRKELETIHDGITEFMNMFLFEFRGHDYVPCTFNWGDGRTCKMILSVTDDSGSGHFSAELHPDDLISKY